MCTLINLFNREIIGYAAGEKKDAKVVEETLLKTNFSLKDIRIFHSDRGNEYHPRLEKAHENDSPFVDFIIDRELESQKDFLRMLQIPL